MIPSRLITELYEVQKSVWPKSGRHILAQYTDDAILVYQAYNKDIGSYAVKNKKFDGCEKFSPNRMTWIKTNFLWMMYRCDWGEKDPNQEMILGIWLKREAFERILDHAVYSSYKEELHGSKEEYDKLVQKSGSDPFGFVRLQWDPDHHPGGSKHPERRAIQLGMKKVRSFTSGEDIIDIWDLTPFVTQQRARRVGNISELVTPKETVYKIDNEQLKMKINVEECNS
eukprot:TRINITY_DN11699_c0_g1_i1.p1 TRINITY_DN11699_c0_g1~~TRINITY_DN11699_c0_g1_i1.p1  ORF type:complete len:227 (+),score=36.17 TRINITY_DN11699_c0_g1_i1:184-864(+)